MSDSANTNSRFENEDDALSSSHSVPVAAVGGGGAGVEDLDWEEWDGESPFWHHCIAGSLAGVAEHVLFYPVDTVKTHMQSYCDHCPHKNTNTNTSKGMGTNQLLSSFQSSKNKNKTSPIGMWSTMRRLIQTGHVGNHHGGGASSGGGAVVGASGNGSSLLGHHRPATTLVAAPVCEKTLPKVGGFGRLWRGVQTMAVGCVPAHALYFSIYELVKPYNAALAGAAAALAHDMVMTPLDTVKQRLQLGHYKGDMTYAVRTIYQQEGYLGLYRSFPITLLTNLPYGILMVSTNEYLRHYLLQSNQHNHHPQPLDLKSTMIAGCGAGAVASALTTPLDYIKTRLQTQRLLAMSILQETTTKTTTKTTKCPSTCDSLLKAAAAKPKYTTVPDAIRVILKEDGISAFFRGITPRVLTHTPAVAISWTTYEMAKSWLAQTTTYLSPTPHTNPHL